MKSIEEIRKQQMTVIYSLPVGFRKILEEVMRDYSLTLGMLLGVLDQIDNPLISELIPGIEERKDKFELMMEYSKKWEETL